MKKYLKTKNYINYIKKYQKKLFPNYSKISYSQLGEDLIIDFILKNLKISKPTYLDIGAHHPTLFSNTYFFYKKGSKGICIEPDPFLCKQIKKKRKKDTCLNVGIGTEEEQLADFYIMNAKVLNTFSKKEADYLVNSTSKKIEKIIKIPLVPINKIITKYLNNEIPNFVSLDTEGYDFRILKSLNFKNFRPEIFCVETLTYTENKTERKERETIAFMAEKRYFVYADTYINTIFVDKNKWLNR